MLSTFQQGLGRAIRASGCAFEFIGQKLEVNAYVEQLQPSLRSIKYKGTAPVIAGGFVAPSAAVVGRVTVGANSSIWYGATLRGDVSTITIGEDVTIGDRAMIHCASHPKEFPTVIGNKVLVGSGAIIHGCELQDGSVIGEGAQIMDGAKVEKNAVVGAGSVVSPGKVVPAGQYWAGVPAKYQRDLTSEELLNNQTLVQENVNLALLHAKENAKTWQEIELEEYNHEQQAERNPNYYRRLSVEELSAKLGEVEGHTVPGRVFDSPVSSLSSSPSELLKK